MKTKHLIPVLVAATVITFNLTARAEYEQDGPGDCGTNSCNTNNCNICGSESMYAVVVLEATSNAPTGASGIAKIESDDCGTSNTAVDLKTFALDPGDYDLVISLAAEGTNVVIGQFTVDNGNCGGQGCGWGGGGCGGGWGGGGWGGWGGGNEQDSLRSDDNGDDGGQWIPCGWGGCDNWGEWTNWSDTNFCVGTITNFPVVTRTEAELPPGIDPTDIAEISVTDTNGDPFLVGDVTNPAPSSVINISATVRVTPGVAAPSTTGTAHLKSTAIKGKWKHEFSLSASGMVSKSTYKLSVNGKISGAAKATKSGGVTIKKLPSHTPALRSLIMLDSKGKEAASAHF